MGKEMVLCSLYVEKAGRNEQKAGRSSHGAQGQGSRPLHLILQGHYTPPTTQVSRSIL